MANAGAERLRFSGKMRTPGAERPHSEISTSTLFLIKLDACTTNRFSWMPAGDVQKTQYFGEAKIRSDRWWQSEAGGVASLSKPFRGSLY